jgi:CRP-like cAMP-binding protein
VVPTATMSAVKARRDVKVEHLRDVPLFDGIAEIDLRDIALMADEVAVPSGYVLVYEGDWGDEVFVVAEGEAVVVAGESRAMAPAGSVIGELAALPPPPAGATVTAATPMRFFVFERAGFASLLHELPLLAGRTASGKASRLQPTSGLTV